MIEFTDINIDTERFRVSARDGSSFVNFELRDLVNDLARQVQDTAQQLAPVYTGLLSAEGISINEADPFSLPGDEGRFGEVVTDLPAIGGGFTVRGGNPRNRGQFSAASFREPGFVFEGRGITPTYQADVFLNPAVAHARWVHDGTGIYGPFKSPIVPRTAPFMVFFYEGKKWIKREVKGQKPQPFLTDAFRIVNNSFTPLKLAELRAEINSRL